MKSLILKITLILLTCVLAVWAFNATTSSKQGNDLVPPRNRLRWHAAEAKKEGKQRVVIATDIAEYGGSASDIDQASSFYTIVMAEPVEKRTYEFDDNRLQTWYRFRILERLTEVKPPGCYGCFDITPPLDMPFDHTSEFLVPRGGGTITLDGVQVEEKEQGFPEFQEGQKYLLFVELYPNGVGTTAGGPLGVFVVESNEHLKPLQPEANLIGNGMNAKFQNSLKNLKQKLSNR